MFFFFSCCFFVVVVVVIRRLFLAVFFALQICYPNVDVFVTMFRFRREVRHAILSLIICLDRI